MDYKALLDIAIEEAKLGLAEGGIPIGAALFDATGKLLGRGHNRRVQQGDPSVHGETDAFRNAGRQRSYRYTIMVTTLARLNLQLQWLSFLINESGGPESGRPILHGLLN